MYEEARAQFFDEGADLFDALLGVWAARTVFTDVWREELATRQSLEAADDELAAIQDENAGRTEAQQRQVDREVAREQARLQRLRDDPVAARQDFRREQRELARTQRSLDSRLDRLYAGLDALRSRFPNPADGVGEFARQYDALGDTLAQMGAVDRARIDQLLLQSDIAATQAPRQDALDALAGRIAERYQARFTMNQELRALLPHATPAEAAAIRDVLIGNAAQSHADAVAMLAILNSQKPKNEDAIKFWQDERDASMAELEKLCLERCKPECEAKKMDCECHPKPPRPGLGTGIGSAAATAAAAYFDELVQREGALLESLDDELFQGLSHIESMQAMDESIRRAEKSWRESERDAAADRWVGLSDGSLVEALTPPESEPSYWELEPGLRGTAVVRPSASGATVEPGVPVPDPGRDYPEAIPGFEREFDDERATAADRIGPRTRSDLRDLVVLLGQQDPETASNILASIAISRGLARQEAMDAAQGDLQRVRQLLQTGSSRAQQVLDTYASTVRPGRRADLAWALTDWPVLEAGRVAERLARNKLGLTDEDLDALDELYRMALDSRISGDEALETWRTSALIPEDAFWDLWLELRQSPRAPMESVGQRDARFERARARDKHYYSRLVNELLTSQGRESISLAEAERDLQHGVDVALAQRLEGPARAAELRRALSKTQGVPLRPDDVKQLSDAEVYAAYLGVDSRWRGESGVGAPKLSHADELQKMLRGQPYNARGVRQALQEARELLFEESSRRYNDFRLREGEIQRARVGGAILSGLTFGFFDLESLGIYDPAVLQLARQESSAALDALITGIEWAPVVVSLGVSAVRTLAPGMFGRQGAWATSLVAARRATGVVRRATSARRGVSRGVAAYRGPQVAAPGGASLNRSIDLAETAGVGFGALPWSRPPTHPRDSEAVRAALLRTASSKSFAVKLGIANVLAVGRPSISVRHIQRVLRSPRTKVFEAPGHGVLGSRVWPTESRSRGFSGLDLRIAAPRGASLFKREIRSHELLHVAQFLRHPSIGTYALARFYHEPVPGLVGSPFTQGPAYALVAGVLTFDVYWIGRHYGWWD